MHEVPTSRRAVMCALAIAPTVIAPSGAAGDGNEWASAQATYVKARRTMKAYDRDYLTPAGDRYLAWRRQWPMNMDMNISPEMKVGYDAESALYDPVQEHFDALVEAQCEALDAMIECPAPHVNAIADKIKALIDNERWQGDGFEEVMGYLFTDVRRLGGN